MLYRNTNTQIHKVQLPQGSNPSSNMIDWRFALKKSFSEILRSTIIAQIVSSLLLFSQINFQQLADFLNLDADAKYAWLTICYISWNLSQFILDLIAFNDHPGDGHGDDDGHDDDDDLGWCDDGSTGRSEVGLVPTSLQ